MPAPRIIAEYLLETPVALAQAAESLAGEQSTGTFTAVPGETADLQARFAARVESVEHLDAVERPSLPGAAEPRGDDRRYQRGRVRVSFSLENMGHNLPTIISTIAGNLFELRYLSGLRLTDVQFPAELRSSFPGPQFGIPGTRQLAEVYDRPLIGTIIKPSVGLSPAQTAGLVHTLGMAGIDFIKDDELMASPPHSPLAERVRAVMAAINDVAEKTARKPMYAFNISDSLDEMMAHHDVVLASGGTCVMVSLNSVGYAGVEFLRRRCQLPIHGHRNGWGMLNRCPALGMEFKPYQKIWRLVGIDQLHVNGLKNKFCESDESVVRSIQACLDAGGVGQPLFPVVSSGQWGGQAPQTYRQTHTVDLIYLAGGGILAHPGGPAAGVAALRQCWEAAVTGKSLAEMARQYEPLRQSLEFFGQLPHSR